MFETFTITQMLSVFMGLYFISAGVGMMLGRDDIGRLIEEFRDSAALGYIGGIMAFITGAILISLHQDYSNLHAGFISVIGWIALIKGCLLLAFGPLLLNISANLFNSSKTITIISIITILLGVWMMSVI